MFFFKNIVDDVLSLNKEKRLKDIDSFTQYLSILADFGKIDSIYFSINYLDNDFVNINKEYLYENKVFLRLKKISDEFFDSNYTFFDFSNNNSKHEILLNNFLKYFNGLDSNESSHEENFRLNFLLNCIMERGLLSSDLGIKLIEYFWRAKNCNPRRKDYCIFSIVDTFINSDNKLFFKLQKTFYNHIQKIYHQTYRSELLNEENKYIYMYSLNKIIKKHNKLKSKSNFKVAVCVSGLYRNHIESLLSIKNNIIDPLYADVFVHTWDQKSIWTGIGGYSNYTRLFGFDSKLKTIIPSEVQNLKNLERFLPKTFNSLKEPRFVNWNAEEIKNILKPKKIIIENQLDFENKLDNKSNYITRGSLNQIKMFYGMKQSFDLALDFDEYDYIIRIRPDVLVENKVSIDTFHKLQNNIIYTSSGDVALQEMEFVASQSTIKNLSGLISKMFTFEKVSLYSDFPLYDAHNVMFAWMVEGNYVFGKDLMDRKILTMDKGVIIDGLNKSIDDDFNNLNENDKLKFFNFISFLKKNYC